MDMLRPGSALLLYAISHGPVPDFTTFTMYRRSPPSSARALRYMRAYVIDPAETTMPMLLQRMVGAETAGGAFSLTSATGPRGGGTMLAIPEGATVAVDGITGGVHWVA